MKNEYKKSHEAVPLRSSSVASSPTFCCEGRWYLLYLGPVETVVAGESGHNDLSRRRLRQAVKLLKQIVIFKHNKKMTE